MGEYAEAKMGIEREGDRLGGEPGSGEAVEAVEVSSTLTRLAIEPAQLRVESDSSP